MFILTGIAIVYCIIIGLSATIAHNVNEYKETGYVDISLKWLITTPLYFVGHTLLTVVKYVIAICIGILLLGLVMLSEGEIIGDWGIGKSDFWKKWFIGEVFLFGGLFKIVTAVVMVCWVVLSFVWVHIIANPVCWVWKYLVASPFIWLRKSWGTFFDKSMFTIGRKPKR